MLKKLLIALAPLLAIAALAAMPVAAQAAEQHWYRNGVAMPEGEVTPFVLWGGNVNLNQISSFGEVNCRTVGGGTIENHFLVAPSVGSLTALAFYECKGPQCEEAVLKELGVQGREYVEAKNMPASINGHPERRFVPYSMQLEESTVAGVSSVRVKIGNWNGKFETPSPPARIRVRDECEVAATEQVTGEGVFEGELQPEIGAAKGGNLNGTSASKPSQMRFDGPALSTNELHSMAFGPATYAGNLKYQGYNEQELITVKP